MKRKSAIAIICVLAVLLLAAPLSYAWFSYSLKSEAHMDSYVHKSYFESGDGTSAEQFIDGLHATEEGCAFEIKYPVQLYYFAWLQALGYFNIPNNGSEIDQVYFYLSDDLDMTGWVLPQVGTQTYPFVGNFNGNGHTISNLTVQNVEGTGANAWTDKPDDITGLNIVGFFGVVGSLNPAGSANAGEVNAAVNSGSNFTPTAGYTYDNAVNEIKNFILEDTVIKTDLANSLAGIAAGYVNGTMENVKVVGGTLHSTATTALAYTANLSDFGAVGYCTDEYKGSNQVITVLVYDPQAVTNSGMGSAIGQGNNWGGSVDMLSMYGDLLKADFVQLAHHGMTNGYGRNMPNMILFYAKVQPEIILWPNSKEQYYNPQDDELIAVFDWNLEAQKYAKETWLAGGDEITVFELPYTLGSAHAFDPEPPA